MEETTSRVFRDDEGQQLTSEDERFSSEPAGYLLGRIGLIFLLAILGLALWFKQVVIAILIGLTLVAALLSKLWSHFSLKRLYTARRVSGTHLFPGEHVDIDFKVTNRKLLPLPWLQIYDDIPSSLAKGTSSAVENYPGSYSLSYAAVMPWYSSITWHNRIVCTRRGYYDIGPLTVTSGDILGFYPRLEYRKDIEHIVVYPRLYPVAEADLPSIYPMGETKAPRYIFEDPTRPIGVRDYNFQDSLRYIHWKASARHQKLKVKVFEPTTTLKVAFFIAVDSFTLRDDADTERFELGISAAASLARFVIENRSSAGVYVNSRLVDLSGPVKTRPGSDTGHLVAILESLAKVTAYPNSSFVEFLKNETASMPWGVTLALVLSEPVEGLESLLADLKKRGNKLVILQIGNKWKPRFPGIRTHRIETPHDLLRVGFKGEYELATA